MIGETPLAQVHQRIETILHTLTGGEQVTLDRVTLTALLERRAQQTQFGPRVERHYHVPNQQE